MQVDKTQHPEKLSNPRSKIQIQRQRRAISRATSNKEKAELQTLYGVNNRENPLLRLSVDFTQ